MVNLKVRGWNFEVCQQQQQQQAAAELRILFVHIFTVNHFYHREYIDFHRKMLKPLKIVLGNRTPCSRGGISAALRASCVLIVRSVCRIWASCQVGILLFDSLKGQSGEPWPCQRFKAGVELGLFCWKTVKESQGWLSSVNARVQFPSTGETTSEKLWCLILKDGVCMTQTSCTYTTNGNCKLFIYLTQIFWKTVSDKVQTLNFLVANEKFSNGNNILHFPCVFVSCWRWCHAGFRWRHRDNQLKKSSMRWKDGEKFCW